ncbi:uncharacterized protein LOC104581650 [Brachypodium distachyon]|uniref:Late embryogenesis abundant protein LEA-2 subgroup domain-containing protein n=1 Tax=Brachypodium distachyon TaxID=15368 RepID=I1H126_BRADI|nr:uncharacterized protein LOC104581650 [Brachypodium distachyon]KQK19625.1 hypothetical protein BRADI_1g49400v3 [Brachypodium distachyon]|eukprot:XP_010228038.1 uncharacterized protein LOC104581650 [Brachypodium distachyon]
MAACNGGSGQFTASAWGPKQYILAAVATTLAVSAVAIATSVVLSPARVVFSVTVAGASAAVPVPSGGVLLNFTLDAANPSRRAGVEYDSLTASLRLHSASHRAAGWAQTEVRQPMPLLQPPACSRSFPASAFFERSFVALNFGGGRGPAGGPRPAAEAVVVRAPPMSVLVAAQVRFKVGLAYSRPYDIEVICQPVDFFAAAAAAAVATTVACVA